MGKLEKVLEEEVCERVADGHTKIAAYRAGGFPGKQHDAAVERRGLHFYERPRIRARIEELLKKNRKKITKDLGVSKEYVLKGLQENYERSIGARTIIDLNGQESQKMVNGANATKALELLGKEQGMFVERHSFESLDEKLEGMGSKELRQMAMGLASSVGLRVVGMDEEGIRAYCLREGPRVGLVVTVIDTDHDGTDDAETGAIPAIPKASGVP